MELTEILLVIENDKGTEKNLLMNFTEYMLQFGSRVEKTPMEAALHTLDLERTRMDNEMWTELYFAANKSVHARYCSGLDQLSNFLAGAHNDRNLEHYLDENRCSQECLEFLEEIGMNRKGCFSQDKSMEKEYSVEIREILSRVQTVRAPSLGEAIDKVMEQYYKTEIVLYPEDFKEVTFEQEKKERGR